MTDLSTSTTSTIDAPVQDVWDAITTPELIKQWFFGVDTETDWTPGGPIVHRGEWQGKPYKDKGQIVEVEPPRLLVHTHWSDLSGTPDRPEHYQEVTWALAEREGRTELTVSERNVPSEEAKAIS
ncbi:MAG: SRPBCC family protein, partial [Actinomycetota bacterium]